MRQKPRRYLKIVVPPETVDILGPAIGLLLRIISGFEAGFFHGWVGF